MNLRGSRMESSSPLVEWIYLVVVLCLAGKTWAQASQECIDGLQVCTNSYVQATLSNPQDRKFICREVNIFARCILQLDCDMPQSSREMVIRKLREEISRAGIYCTIDTDGVTTRNPVSTLAPEMRSKNKMTDCGTAATVCINDYMNSIFDVIKEEVMGVEWLCPLIDKLINCLGDSPCTIDTVEGLIENRLEEEFKKHNLQCEIDLSVLRKRKNKGGHQDDSSEDANGEAETGTYDTENSSDSPENAGPTLISSAWSYSLALALCLYLSVLSF